MPEGHKAQGGISRRALFAAAGAGAVGGYGLGAALGEGERHEQPKAISIFGSHQAGIATAPQEHLTLAAFDLEADDATALRTLLVDWSEVAEHLAAGRPAPQRRQGIADTGEATGLEPGSLTLTFGLGATVFRRGGRDRLGLADLQPAPLFELPYFEGDTLDARRSNGDLCVQVCADDPQVVFHAIHTLTRAAAGTASLRWAQSGFRGASRPREEDPRNLMGFRDGTVNVDYADDEAMRRSVWVDAGESPAWMSGGTYLVARRIQMLLDSWDALSNDGQEQAVGRDKTSGAPLGGGALEDPPQLDARQAGQLVIPDDAHIRLAAPAAGDGPPPLRRSYSFADGIDPATGQVDAGLLFLSFQRSPATQFTPIQRRLAASDALGRHLQHTASAVFACLPGIQRGGYLGESLFENV